MGLTSGIAKLISLIWIGAMAWSIERVSKLRTDEPWEAPATAHASSRTLPFEGVALAGTPGPKNLGAEGFGHRSASATRGDAAIETVEFDALGEPPALVAEMLNDRVLPVLLQMVPPVVQEALETECLDSPAGEAVVAIGPVEEPVVDEPLEVRTGGGAAVVAQVEQPAATDAERAYRVVRGDTVHRIAKRKFGSSEPGLIQAIYEANPQLRKNPNKLKVGDALRLPTWPRGAALGGGRGSLARS